MKSKKKYIIVTVKGTSEFHHNGSIYNEELELFIRTKNSISYEIFRKDYTSSDGWTFNWHPIKISDSDIKQYVWENHQYTFDEIDEIIKSDADKKQIKKYLDSIKGAAKMVARDSKIKIREYERLIKDF